MDNLGPTNEVFLAIDNVWPKSLEAAKRILRVNFSVKSKILLTSRSNQVLKDLDGRGITVAPLPSPDQAEAFQIFQDSFELGSLESLRNTNLLNSVLERCFFSDQYHPLALKAVARYVHTMCYHEDLNKIGDILSGFLQETDQPNDVEDLLRLHYEKLAKEKQYMFLDIVVVLINKMHKWGHMIKDEVAYKKAHKWLSILYKKNSTHLIHELALDGLIQLDESAEKVMIRVHDLYYDLARKEAARSARFLQEVPESGEEIKWEMLERVIIRTYGDDRFEDIDLIKELQQHQCPKLQVLILEFSGFLMDQNYAWILQLDLMPSLCVLRLYNVGIVMNCSIKNWSAARGLAIVHLKNWRVPLEPIPSIPCLEELIIENTDMKGTPNLAACQRLKKLVLFNLGEDEEDDELEEDEACRVLNVNALVNLQVLRIGSWGSIERIEGLDALKKLQRFHVEHLPYQRNLDGLSGLLQLEAIEIGGNANLKKMPDLSGLTRLERLVLLVNKSIEEVEGLSLSPALKYVRVSNCKALKRMPDLSGLTCLKRLDLYRNESMEEVGGLSPALKHVTVSNCNALKRMPDLSGLTCLEGLELYGNESMEEVGGENLSSTLTHLIVYDCRSLRRFPSLKESVHLQDLKASGIFIRGSLQNLSNLQRLHLVEGGRTSLEMSGLTSLQRLTIEGYDALLKLGVDILPCTSLTHLKVSECRELEEIGDLSALLSLERLEISSCPSLKNLGGLFVHSLWSADWEPEDIQYMISLLLNDSEDIIASKIEHNKSMQMAVGGLSPALKEVVVAYCNALKRMPDLSGLTCLKSLKLDRNESMEEVEGLSPALKVESV